MTLAVKQVRKRVFLRADGPNPVVVAKVYDVNGNEQPDAFDDVDYWTLEILCQPPLVVDTRSKPSAIQYLGLNAIEFALGDLVINPGVYLARLKVHDQEHDDGQQIAHERGPNQLWLEFV